MLCTLRLIKATTGKAATKEVQHQPSTIQKWAVDEPKDVGLRWSQAGEDDHCWTLCLKSGDFTDFKRLWLAIDSFLHISIYSNKSRLMSSIFLDSVSNSVKSHSSINRSRILSQISLPPSREIYFVIVNPLLSSLSLKKNLCVQILFSMHQVAKQASFFIYFVHFDY